MAAQELSNANEGLHQHFLTIRCPHCAVRWLAPGVGHGETYVCKACGLSFVIDKSPPESTSELQRVDVQ